MSVSSVFQQELEEAAASGSGEAVPEPTPSVSQLSGGLMEKIYAQTRKQAAAVHAKVASIGPPLDSLVSAASLAGHQK